MPHHKRSVVIKRTGLLIAGAFFAFLVSSYRPDLQWVLLSVMLMVFGALGYLCSLL